MTNLLVLLNIVSLISSNQSIQFSELLNRAETSDISFAEVNNISDWNDYEVYLRDQVELNNNSSEKSKGDGNDGSISDSILEVEDYLNEIYSDYYWIRDDENCALTSDVSNHIPIEMQSSYFPSSDIDKAIVVAGVEDETSYGGCGPIASLGIMDYFARYLGYDEIISDPTNSDGEWVTSLDILNDITLNEGYDLLETYGASFPEGAYTFRIYAYSPTIGIHNKGRISIGNMALYTVD